MLFISTSLVNRYLFSLQGCKNSTWNKIEAAFSYMSAWDNRGLSFFAWVSLLVHWEVREGFLSLTCLLFLLPLRASKMNESLQQKSPLNRLFALRRSISVSLLCVSLSASHLPAVCLQLFIFLCARFCACLPSSCIANYLPACLSVDPHAFPRA